MHDSWAERSRNPTVLTRSSSPSSAKQTFVRAVTSLATVTTRKTAARDKGASMLCASIGTLSQFFFDIPSAPRFSELQTPCLRVTVIEWPRWNVSPELLMRRALRVRIVASTSHIYTDRRQH